MPHWLIKSAVQRFISWLPNSHWWNEQLQRRLTGSLGLDDQTFDVRLDWARRHVEQLAKTRSLDASPFNAIDLGTGWYPIVPASFWLCGAERVWTYDIAPLMTGARLNATFKGLAERARRGDLSKHLPSAMPERIARLNELHDRSAVEQPAPLLASIGIEVKIQDARHTMLDPRSVDLFTSTGVLEYIDRPALAAIFDEFTRIARPGAVSTHYVDLTDQYHYFDRSISPLNFLRFTEGQWRVFNSPLTPLSRLRHSDYLNLLRASGWEIVCDEPRRAAEADLDRVPLAPEFRNYTKDDLRVSSLFVAARLKQN